MCAADLPTAYTGVKFIAAPFTPPKPLSPIQQIQQVVESVQGMFCGSIIVFGFILNLYKLNISPECLWGSLLLLISQQIFLSKIIKIRYSIEKYEFD